MRRDGSWVGTLTMSTPESSRLKGSQRFPTAHRTSGFDSLDKALIVYKQRAKDPNTGILRDIYRRVDLIAVYKRYYATVRLAVRCRADAPGHRGLDRRNAVRARHPNQGQAARSHLRLIRHLPRV